jgi:hypothetical protein
MRHSHILTAAGLLIFASVAAPTAFAQFPYATRPIASPALNPALNPPVYSPYLNVLRGGGSFSNNYFGLVVPQIQARNAILGLQQSVAQEAATTSTGAPLGPLTTGHGSRFFNYSHFFQNPGTQQFTTAARTTSTAQQTGSTTTAQQTPSSRTSSRTAAPPPVR